ncbi:choice-of-anchor Q domain-containing protein [Dyadobacter sp. LHD-138]|uniref:choice-of-anchor Q domain-containing protein n=1 Tax=Dyadobacter sp. LHD-138 TaxID=3071413 RepID=UPI0027E0EE9D|nr:choice-of-anchor Q domain-containing protein [Dyadobacter sp. LHD-138]MDQ6476868.1 choice-of-anchor Q domain-containing protein [Dyadobacter sp. LHD-138]
MGTIDMGSYESQGTFDGTLYVKEGATGTGIGWNTPLGQLSGALQVAHYSTVVQQIYVAKGSYSPQFTASGTAIPEEERTFLLANNVKIYGGFDPDNGITNLSHGRLSGATYLDGKLTAANTGVYHVVVAAGEVGTAVLDGFVIQNGKADPTGNNEENATINGLAVDKKYGGGVTLVGASPLLNNLIIKNNTAKLGGGGVFSEKSEAEITRTVISGNSSGSLGGGVAIGILGNAHFTNVLITGNTAALIGSGFLNTASPTLTNVTISGNSPATLGGEWRNSAGTAVIRNSIIWGNGISGELYDYQHSLVQGYTTTTGNNISGETDPLFVGNGDYSLQPASPVINKGSNARFPGLSAVTTDLAGNPRVFDYANGGVIDMGAYELPENPFPIRYVRETPSGTGSGSSWANASDNLQAMINTTGTTQVWVAKGTYKPTTMAGNGTTDRDKAFVLKSNVKVYGGFAGTETTLEARRLELTANKSTLSGDLGIADDPADNSYHVVLAAGALGNAELNGFTVTAGNADGGSSNLSLTGHGIARNLGGGVYIHSGAPMLSNVTFSANTAGNGGGMYHNNAAPLLDNVTISNNTATSNGAGMYNAAGSSPQLNGVLISANQADGHGSGMYNAASNPVLNAVSLRGNLATGNGGGINNASGSNPVITNTLFSGNKANTGGGMYSNNGSMPVVRNATFVSNSASIGGAIYNIVSGTRLALYNSIVYGNSSGVVDASGATASVINYCNIQSYSGGTGNIQTDPLFTNTRTYTDAPFTDGIYFLQSGSPAINTGDPQTNESGYAVQSGDRDLAGNVRILSNRVDRGAYEYNCVISPASNAPSASHWISPGKNYLYTACNLLAIVEPTGASQVQGYLTAQSWTEQNIVQYNTGRYVRRHYNLTPAENAENATANITLFFTKEDFQHYNANFGSQNALELPVNPSDDKTKLLVVQYHAGDGQTGMPGTDRKLITPTLVSWNSNTQLWEVKFAVNGFSVFFVTAQNATALPVTLLSFQAQKQESNVQLNWQTTSEENASHFDVQRSMDAKTFETIATIKASGKSTALNSYGYTDHFSGSLPSLIYYRLKAVDMDNTYAYSRMVSVNGDGKTNFLTALLYPNPSNGETTLDLTGFKDDVIISLYNLPGQQIQLPVTYQNGKYLLNTRGLTSGIYLIHVSDGQHKVVARLVVK